jgi:hypothetical protein
VPDTQLAVVHGGEMIVPSEYNPLNPNKATASIAIRDEDDEIFENSATHQLADLMEKAVISASGDDNEDVVETLEVIVDKMVELITVLKDRDNPADKIPQLREERRSLNATNVSNFV